MNAILWMRRRPRETKCYPQGDLFVTQGSDGVDPRGSQGRYVPRKQGDGPEEQRRTCNGEQVIRLNSKQLISDHFRKRQARRQTPAMPIPTRMRTSRMISHTTFPLRAPSAIRMPISRDRWATVYAITP